MTGRPTKEQLAEIRDGVAIMRTVPAIAYSTEPVKMADALGMLLAEVDALTENPPHTGEVTRRAISEREDARADLRVALAGAQSLRDQLACAERERDEARAALVRLQEAMVRVADAGAMELAAVHARDAEGCPDEGWGDDAPPGWVAWRAARDARCAAVREQGAALDAIAASTTADLAEAQRREWMAQGMDEAKALANAELQGEAVARDRAYAAGRKNVGSHRQAGVEAIEPAIRRISERAADLRGGK